MKKTKKTEKKFLLVSVDELKAFEDLFYAVDCLLFGPLCPKSVKRIEAARKALDTPVRPMNRVPCYTTLDEETRWVRAWVKDHPGVVKP